MNIFSNQTGTQDRYTTKFGLLLSIYAKLDNKNSSLSIDLAYSLQVRTIATNITTGEILSNTTTYNATILNTRQFGIYPEDANGHHPKTSGQVTETVLQQNDNTTLLTQRHYPTKTSSYSDFLTKDGSFIENGFVFNNFGTLEILNSASINSQLFLVFNAQYLNEFLNYLSGSCKTQNQIKVCTTIHSVIFRAQVNWLYDTPLKSRNLFQPYQYLDLDHNFGQSITVDPYITYIGYTHSINSMSTPIYGSGNNSPIPFRFGTYQYNWTCNTC